jgi:hypothetical protein
MDKPRRTPEEILAYTQNRAPEEMASDFLTGVRQVGPERFAAMQIALQDAVTNKCECSVCYSIRSVYESIWDVLDE